ncbi:MAG: hypothetical protein IKW89_00975 [Bacteroidales bacterium]|nr:hypothetical protein [Bacteroidales bacterium]
MDSNRIPISYDSKILEGYAILGIQWLEYRDKLYYWACKNSRDNRWKDEGFKKHMYDQYINTDRPITNQLFNLDEKNLKTVYDFVDQYVMSNTTSYWFETGKYFRINSFKEL